MLVGTATTGAGVSPPTRLANAPSIPAINHHSLGRHQQVGVLEQAVDAGHAAVGHDYRLEAQRPQRGRALLGYWQVGRPRGEHRHLLRPCRRRAPINSPPGLLTSGMSGQDRGGLIGIGPAEDHRPPVGLGQQLTHDGDAVLNGFPRAVDRFGEPLAQRPVVVDAGKTQVSVGQTLQPAHYLVSADGPVLEVTEQPVQGSFVHTCPMVPRFWRLACLPRHRHRPRRSGCAGATRLTGG